VLVVIATGSGIMQTVLHCCIRVLQESSYCNCKMLNIAVTFSVRTCDLADQVPVDVRANEVHAYSKYLNY
jgi:hypothetical protein